MAECLRGLEFCDEIVVVADRCTDRSQEIARHHGARVIDGIFPLESQRKTAGVSACLGEWILEVEPDEVVQPALAYEIRATIHGRPGGDWFDLPMQHHVGDAVVRRGWDARVGEVRAARLYRQRAKRWKAGRVQPDMMLEGRYAGTLETALVRRLEPGVSALFARLDRLTALRAQDRADAGETGRLYRDLLSGLGRFWASYVWRQGVREGEPGFLIALAYGLDTVLSGIRARELVRQRATAVTVEPVAQPRRIAAQR